MYYDINLIDNVIYYIIFDYRIIYLITNIRYKIEFINYKVTASTYNKYHNKSKKEKYKNVVFIFTDLDINVLKRYLRVLPYNIEFPMILLLNKSIYVLVKDLKHIEYTIASF